MADVTISSITKGGENDIRNENQMEKSMPGMLKNQGLGDYYSVAEKILLGLVELINKVNPNVSVIRSKKGKCTLFLNCSQNRGSNEDQMQKIQGTIQILCNQ